MTPAPKRPFQDQSDEAVELAMQISTMVMAKALYRSWKKNCSLMAEQGLPTPDFEEWIDEMIRKSTAGQNTWWQAWMKMVREE